jgi:hypothetical protein
MLIRIVDKLVDRVYPFAYFIKMFESDSVDIDMQSVYLHAYHFIAHMTTL